TRIRELIASGRSPRWLLPDAVIDYIRQEGLYQGVA
ncbi:MAG TPA: nicotinic acid mononucleotide adenylyltransferase, partial [Gammaproteobacteria bacterium]